MPDRDAFRRRLPALKGAVEARLDELSAHVDGGPEPLTEAVRYALLAPGKRLRPLLTVAAAAHFGAEEDAALDPGCAIEMVHAASLILDDLPCMDDAALRRGQPTVHRRYGEDVAVLAAVALLNAAFGVAAEARGVSADCRLRLVRRLSRAVGFEGLVAGQVRDLREAAGARSEQGLASLNHQKTGALFVAAVETGACLAMSDRPAQAAAREFGLRLGQAFQIRDDLADARAGFEDAGKDAGQDQGKVTVVSLVGPERARQAMEAELQAAEHALLAVRPRGPLFAFLDLLRGPATVAA